MLPLSLLTLAAGLYYGIHELYKLVSSALKPLSFSYNPLLVNLAQALKLSIWLLPLPILLLATVISIKSTWINNDFLISEYFRDCIDSFQHTMQAIWAGVISLFYLLLPIAAILALKNLSKSSQQAQQLELPLMITAAIIACFVIRKMILLLTGILISIITRDQPSQTFQIAPEVIRSRLIILSFFLVITTTLIGALYWFQIGLRLPVIQDAWYMLVILGIAWYGLSCITLIITEALEAWLSQRGMSLRKLYTKP